MLPFLSALLSGLTVVPPLDPARAQAPALDSPESVLVMPSFGSRDAAWARLSEPDPDPVTLAPFDMVVALDASPADPRLLVKKADHIQGLARSLVLGAEGQSVHTEADHRTAVVHGDHRAELSYEWANFPPGMTSMEVRRDGSENALITTTCEPDEAERLVAVVAQGWRREIGFEDARVVVGDALIRLPCDSDARSVASLRMACVRPPFRAFVVWSSPVDLYGRSMIRKKAAFCFSWIPAAVAVVGLLAPGDAQEEREDLDRISVEQAVDLMQSWGYRAELKFYSSGLATLFPLNEALREIGRTSKHT